LTLGAPSPKCQVTKGAHVWSWQKTCNPNDLRDLGFHAQAVLFLAREG
jgi:hypothetical protein